MQPLDFVARNRYQQPIRGLREVMLEMMEWRSGGLIESKTKGEELMNEGRGYIMMKDLPLQNSIWNYVIADARCMGDLRAVLGSKLQSMVKGPMEFHMALKVIDEEFMGMMQRCTALSDDQLTYNDIMIPSR
ncbi:hypothetical protein OCU04_005033 [Sclerotinia nivalis]|uniref:Uncharacterized protein n=1 Tax=Sclerotinia nivalis TaxID=352851 RepID=A0A9X0ANJ7_9HELO|nr:hypothetical protein OCU04_005033 [Sclerotinia nivalis]